MIDISGSVIDREGNFCLKSEGESHAFVGPQINATPLCKT